MQGSSTQAASAVQAAFDAARQFVADQWVWFVPLFAAVLIGLSIGYMKLARERKGEAGSEPRSPVPGWGRVFAFVLFTLTYWLLLNWVLYAVAALLPLDTNEGFVEVASTPWRLVMLAIAMFIASKLVWPEKNDDEDQDVKLKPAGSARPVP